MANLVADRALNMAIGFGVAGATANDSLMTATEYVAVVPGGDSFTYTGSGFTYDADQNVLTGTFTGVSEATPAGTTLYSLANGSLAAGTANSLNLEGGGMALDTAFLQGDDSITGSGLGDTLFGYAGNDTIAVSAGANLVNGNTGNDSIIGGTGADTLYGGQGADTIVAGSGSITLNGNKGADSLVGSASSSLYGGQGDDTIEANGSLFLSGDNGNDSLIGNASGPATAFFFHDNNGIDTIAGFRPGTDKIELTHNLDGMSLSSFSDIANLITTVSGNAVISLLGGNSITILNQTASQLHASDFVFV
jgi:Ca2+-binding RTX toxin-like protein